MSYIEDYCAIVGTPAFEDTIPWLYRDSVGLATTARGFMIPSVVASGNYPWLNVDGSTASQMQIVQDWNRVMALPADHTAEFYKSPAGLYLSQDSIDTLTRNKVLQFDSNLRADYPGYDTFPDSVKLALLDMEWNLGDQKLRTTYPHFDAAVDAQDWALAAAQSGRDTSNPAFNARNAWTKQQFLEAA